MLLWKLNCETSTEYIWVYVILKYWVPQTSKNKGRRIDRHVREMLEKEGNDKFIRGRWNESENTVKRSRGYILTIPVREQEERRALDLASQDWMELNIDLFIGWSMKYLHHKIGKVNNHGDSVYCSSILRIFKPAEFAPECFHNKVSVETVEIF